MGYVSWCTSVDGITVDLQAKGTSMIFTQYYLECLSQASYLIGDETTGRAVVVDPPAAGGEANTAELMPLEVGVATARVPVQRHGA